MKWKRLLNTSFQKRPDKAARGVENLPAKTYTLAEQRAGAEPQIAEMMKEFNLTRGQSIEQAREHAPTIAGWLAG